MEVAHPAAMLYHASGTSTSFANLLRRTAATKPPSVTSPWTLILYADEITPGNQLSHQNDRKVWGVYWSILEFGSAAPAKEDSEHTSDNRIKSYTMVQVVCVECSMLSAALFSLFAIAIQTRRMRLLTLMIPKIQVPDTYIGRMVRSDTHTQQCRPEACWRHILRHICHREAVLRPIGARHVQSWCAC